MKRKTFISSLLRQLQALCCFAGLLLATMLLFSCEKNIVTIPADIAGDYNLVSVEWTLTPIDLNGDGISNNELWPELAELANIKQFLQHGNKSWISLDGGLQNGHAFLYIPMQYLYVPYRNSNSIDEHYMRGDCVPFELFASIGRDSGLVEWTKFSSRRSFPDRLDRCRATVGVAGESLTPLRLQAQARLA